MPPKKTHQEFINESISINGNKYDYSLVEYINSHIKVKIICPQHGMFKQTPYHHINGHGCIKCKGDQQSINQRQKGKDTFKTKANIIHEYKYDYSLVEYESSRKKIIIKCSTHGEFKQTPFDHLQGSGCSKCNTSKGELKIEHWLISNKINYVSQKRFTNCKNKLPLPFDFYIPKLNICIEFDGQQHFIQNQHWGGIRTLESTQKNDGIKTNYCDNNNIKLIRIPYSEFKNINSILENEIKSSVPV